MKILVITSFLVLSTFLSFGASPLRIVCLGDSITGPKPDTRYLDKYVKYADLLQFAFETRLGEGNVEVTNRGFAGNGSSQALARVDSEVLPLKPQIVTVLIGGNNYGNNSDPKAASDLLRRDLTTIVDKLKAAGEKVLLLQYADPKADNMAQVWVHLNAGNPVIAEVARAEGVPTLELAPAFREAAKTHPLAELASSIDGVHLSPYGEVVVARAIFFKLQQLDGFRRPPKPLSDWRRVS